MKPVKTINKIKIQPHGISVGPAKFRPALIFKDQDDKHTLPIWLDALDAGVLMAMSQNKTVNQSVHNATIKLFEALDVKLKTVVFDDVSSSTQYATLEAKQGSTAVKVRVKASEVITLAVQAQCEFFTTENVIEKSRALSLEWLIHSTPGRPGARNEELH